MVFRPMADVLNFGDGERGVVDPDAGSALAQVEQPVLVAIGEGAAAARRGPR